MFRHDFGVIFWIHLGIILAIVMAPFLFNTWIIAAAMLVFWLQLAVFGGCILTRLQFGPRTGEVSQRSFYFHYLDKLGLATDFARVTRFVDRTQPAIILMMGITWQWVLGFQPLII